MKERFFIKGALADKITYYHLLFFVMALPFDRLYSELALGSLALHMIIHLRKENFKKNNLSKLVIPAGIYLLTILGTVYTRFYDEAFYEWERQLALLLFPLIISFNSFDCKKYCFNILTGLGISCFFAIVFLYYEAFTVIVTNHLPLSSIFSNAFLNHNFSAPIDMHATYFSMYIALAAVAILCVLINSDGSIKKWMYGCIFFVLLAGLLQLSSRAVFISFAIIINLVLPFLFFQNKQRTRFIIGSVLFSLSVLYVLTRIDNFKTRFIVDLKEDLTQVSVNNNTLEPRIVRWKAAWPLIQSSPLYGHGSGSEVALLKEAYYERKLYNSYLNELNVHNEYLSMLIKTGVIGLLVLLYILFAGFKNAIRSRDVLFCSFLIIVSVVSFSENILDANKGIFFFAFFYSLFFIRNKEGGVTV